MNRIRLIQLLETQRNLHSNCFAPFAGWPVKAARNFNCSHLLSRVRQKRLKLLNLDNWFLRILSFADYFCMKNTCGANRTEKWLDLTD